MNDGKSSRRIRLFWISGSILWVLAGWWFFFPPSQAAVEQFFSCHWYRWILSGAIPITQLFRIPIIGVLLVAGLIGQAVFWRWVWHRRRGMAGALRGLRSLFLILPILLVWFIAFWGAGYHRMPAIKRLDLDASAITNAEAEKLRFLLLQNIKRDLTPEQERNVDRAVASISASMARIVESWDRRPIALPHRVKAVAKGCLLSFGSSGICSPFTLEALVDGGLPNAAFIFTAAHELGHIAGFCAEDEATFIGYIAGLQAGDRFARYACALEAYADLTVRLNGTEARSAMDALPDLARRDLVSSDEAYRKYRIEMFSRIGWRAYNKYLQAQGIEEGVKNYSRGILLLSYGWRKGLVALGNY
jgi:hypothetical protein